MPICLLASYYEILGLSLDMGERQPSTCIMPAGLAVRFVAVRRLEPWCHLTGLAGLVPCMVIQGLWQRGFSVCHRTGAGDLTQVVKEAKNRVPVLVLIPQKQQFPGSLLMMIQKLLQSLLKWCFCQ